MASQIYRLVMQSGPTPGRVFDLTASDLTIGRDTTNEVVVNDAEVSRKHARLTRSGGSYILEDLGSTNGTFVDGQRLMGPHALRPGDLILLGENVTLRFEAAAFDPDATRISMPGMGSSAPGGIPDVDEPLPPYQPIYQTPPIPPAGEPAPSSYYAEPAPPGPVARRRTPIWLIILIVFLLLCCLCLVGAYLFDANAMYCTPPFDTIFGAFGFCP
jgi:hypothetical protein